MRPLGLLVAIGGVAACLGDSPPGRYDANGEECALTAPEAEVVLDFSEVEARVGLTLGSRFQRSLPPRDAVNCTFSTVGACRVRSCLVRPIDWADGPPVCGETTGGLVEVTRPSQGGARVDGAGWVPLAAPLPVGEVFAVRTTGSDVPAFSASVHLPERVTITGPAAFTAHGTLSLRAGEGFAVTWTPTANRVVLFFTSLSAGDEVAECIFDGSAGRGEVPSDAIRASAMMAEAMSEDRSALRAGDFPANVRARWRTDERFTVARVP